MKAFMKKTVSVLLAVVMAACMTVPAGAAGLSLQIDGKTVDYTGKQVRVKVNGGSVSLGDTPGIIIDGYAMIPYKAVFQQSELLVTAGKSGKKITLGYADNKIVMTLGSKTAYVNGNKKTMPAAPRKVTYTGSKKSAILVPAHYTAGNLGIEYQYQKESNLVQLTGKVNPKADTSKGMFLQYNGKVTQYKGAQTRATLNGTAISSAMPGIILGDVNMVAANAVFAKSPLKAVLKVDKANNRLLITYGTKTVSMEVGTKKAKVNGQAVTMPGKALRIKNIITGKSYYMVPAEFTAKQLGLSYKWNNAAVTAEITAKDLDDNGSLDDSLNGKKTKLKINSREVTLPVDGMVKNGANMVPVRAAFADSVIGVTLKYSSETRTLSLTYGKKTIQMTIGSTTAKVNGQKTTLLAAPYRKTSSAGKSYVMVPSHFVASTFGFGYEWNAKKLTATITGDFKEDNEEEEPGAGTDDTDASDNSDEMRGMWISYLEFDNKLLEEADFQAKIDKMFERCVELNMNAVFVQVRPFGDALYKSGYFPWSGVIAGKQGEDPGYDPLEYMVTKAHDLGLEFHAWINPYRITATYTGTADNAMKALSEDNQAKIWYNSESEEENRNVLNYNKQFYYNPASAQVRNLITNGVKEIVKNYEVDGIHFDDYFYPTFTAKNVSTAFDAEEYADYVYGGGTKTIAQWRRSNVNLLVAKVYKAIKLINEDCVFGISPAGNINNLRSDLQYYVDLDTWLTQEGYIDYICPQIYWGFENGTYSYDKVYDQWAQLERRKDIKLYIGIAAYKAGTASTEEWSSKTNILKRQVVYGRNSGSSDGYLFFRYDSFNTSVIKKELKNLQTVLQ